MEGKRGGEESSINPIRVNSWGMCKADLRIMHRPVPDDHTPATPGMQQGNKRKGNH